MKLFVGNVPRELKEKRQWVGWNKIAGRKVPMCPSTGRAGSSSNPETWGCFKDAVQVAREKNWSGIGFVFNKDYIGIDLDHCVENGVINKYAQNVLNSCTSYTELSPSRTGIHIIARGTIPKALKTTEIEIYNTGRYFTVTGNLIKGRRVIKEVDVSSYYTGSTNEPQSIVNTLQQMKSGNVDTSLTSLAGKLFRKGLAYEEVFVTLKPHANTAGHDDEALHRICKSVSRYHQGEQHGPIRMGQQEEERKPIQVFSPATHTDAFLTSLKQTGNEPIELSTGFPTIDRYTGGLKRKSLWVVGARTGVGKTGFSTTVAEHLLSNNKRVVIFSTETTWETVFARFASMGTGISLHKITDHKEELTATDREKLAEYARAFKSRPLYIIEESEPDLRTVAEEISRIRPDIFIFDYIQHVEESADIRHREIGRFMKGMENIAKQTNSAGLITSQLNRAADVEIPRLSHLSDSSTIENTAHAVILLSKLGQDITIADLAKNRGPKGRVDLRFNATTAQFQELQNA